MFVIILFCWIIALFYWKDYSWCFWDFVNCNNDGDN